jgi:alpha-N-acetylglucosamine transferase
MIKIYCLYYTDKYTIKYVNNLYYSLSNYYKKPFQFICYSDNINVAADKLIPIEKDGLEKCIFNKLKFFSYEFNNIGDNIIVLDIDQIICGNIQDIIDYPVDSELISALRWWPSGTIGSINGGIYKFTMDDRFNNIWTLFNKHREKISELTNKFTTHFELEQSFVEHFAKMSDIKINTFPGDWIIKYKDDISKQLLIQSKYEQLFNRPYDLLDPKVKLIHFAGGYIHKSTNKLLINMWNNI